VHILPQESLEIISLLAGLKPKWEVIFHMFERFKKQSITYVDFIMSKAFYEIIQTA
jgi:hypothetical protein